MSRIVSRIVLAMVVCALPFAAQADPLGVTLNPGSTAGSIDVSLSNSGSSPLSVLKWDTPFEAVLSDDVFHVSHEKNALSTLFAVAYTGPVVKRANPVADSYMTINPGESITTSIALNNYYQISKNQMHKVQFAGKFLYSELPAFKNKAQAYKSNLGALNETSVQSNLMSIKLAPLSTPPGLAARLRTPGYSNCSASETADIQAAATVAERLSNVAVNDLNSLALSERSSSPRYTTWFGEYTATRFEKVVANFTSIQTALGEETIRFDCDCNREGIFAYVYPSNPYNIYLCPAFRRANIDGTDSRAGTIIHELSHFSVLADTDDHVYSTRGAQELANTSPDTAVDNADSHEYFAENSPSLAIRSSSTPSTPANDQPVLTLGQSVSASLSQGERISYQVNGAHRVVLTSNSGDADLYIHSDSSLNAEICQSRHSGNSTDICDNLTAGNLFVSVVAYSAASFTLTAEVQSQTSTVASVLALSTPQQGNLTAGEDDLFVANGASYIEVQSTSGDADLYVYTSSDLSTLICASSNYGDSIDSCVVGDNFTNPYILVEAYTSTQYTLTATGESSTTPEEVVVDMGRLTLNQSYNSTVSEGVFQQFQLNGAASIAINSLTGDADLGVFTGLISSSDTTAICLSQQYSADSTLDQCDIQTNGDVYVYVFGHSDATYTITATDGSNTPTNPADDDPEQPTTTGTVPSGGSGGGSIALFSLLALTLAYGSRNPLSRRAIK